LKQQSEAGSDEAPPPQELWLGYDALLVPFYLISALLVYQPVWDRRIIHDYGRVPVDTQAVVLLRDGRVLPARRTLADLRERWNAWQARYGADHSSSAEHEGSSGDQDDLLLTTPGNED
jgi:hypothetical protein